MYIPFVADLRRAYKLHWPHYFTEAGGVVLFMIASCTTAVLFHHPDSPVRQALGETPILRRAVQSLVIAVALIAIIFNPWGKRSGSHINPAVTLAFRYLGKISPADAFWYITFQCAAAVLSGFALYPLLETWYPHADVHYNLSAPKPENGGWPVALLAEFVISAILMLVTLLTLHSNRFRMNNGWFNIGLIMLYIVFEAPFSGMSTNPARSLGTAAAALNFDAYWIYVVAPVSAMLLTVIVFRRLWKPKPEQANGPVREKGLFTTDAVPPNFPIIDPDKK